MLYITGNLKTAEEKFVQSMKTNVMLLNEVEENEVFEFMENKVNANNAATFYCISKLFNHSNLSKLSLCFIERCFLTVAESNNFLELDFMLARKLLSSNQLKFDTELQVFNVAYWWLCLDITERGKYKERIHLCIPFNLLSVAALDYISDEKSYLDATSAGIIKKVLASKKDFQISIKGEAYAIGGIDNNGNVIMSVEKYSLITKTWKKVADMYDDRSHFCTCYFKGEVFIIGGARSGYSTASCYTFNTTNHTWDRTSGMIETRSFADCSVFKGRIVVTGGYHNNCYHYEELNSVEVYNHKADLWSYMPNMIEKRYRHKSVAIKNKLFVVGGMANTTCEVFDSICDRFVLLKTPTSFLGSLREPAEVISIGSKLVVFCEENILIYDTAQYEWSEKSCSYTLDTFQD